MRKDVTGGVGALVARVFERRMFGAGCKTMLPEGDQVKIRLNGNLVFGLQGGGKHPARAEATRGTNGERQVGMFVVVFS